MGYELYRGELVLEPDQAKNGGFETYKEYIVESENHFNGMYEHNDEVVILVYRVDEDQLHFFLRILQGASEKTLYVEEFKRVLYELVFDDSTSDEEEREVVREEIITTKLFKKVDVPYCIKVIKSAMEKDGLLFEKPAQKAFLRDLEALGTTPGPDEETPVGYDEEEFSDNDLDGIFDFLTLEKEAETVHYDEKTSQLNLLSGMDAFKREMYLLARFAEVNQKLKPGLKKLFPYHYIFSIEPGMGLSTALKFLADHLARCGIVSKSSFVEYKGPLTFDDSNSQDGTTGIFLKGNDGSYKADEDYGVIAVNISKQMDNPGFKLEKMMDILWDVRGKVIFVLVLDGMQNAENARLLRRISSRINCHHIDFPAYTDEELVRIAERVLEAYGLKLEPAARRKFLERIGVEKQNGTFENIRTVQKLMEEIRVEKLFHLPEQGETSWGVVGAQDFAAVARETNKDTESAWKEFDRIIGLEEVKGKVEEIVANAKVQRRRKELGLKTEDLCLHMMFTGNPGTGKTTVARILGRVFKEIGVLRKGELHEVKKDQLIGRYVGHTAPKVRECVKEALGSVLFIDEAYSLYAGDDRKDFGYEAVDMLVKEMEDRRDELVVIMAGYAKEMDKLLDMNPGLKERIPYKIEFPDYTADELTQIFLNCLGKDYVLSEGVLGKITALFEKAVQQAGEDFGNGRFARNVCERLKMKQAMRLCESNSYDREELVLIKLEDVEALYEEEDILGSGKEEKRPAAGIGFRMEQAD